MEIKQWSKYGIVIGFCILLLSFCSTITVNAASYDNQIETLNKLNQRVKDVFSGQDTTNVTIEQKDGKYYYTINIKDLNISNSKSSLVWTIGYYSPYFGEKTILKSYLYNSKICTSLKVETSLSQSSLKKYVDSTDSKINSLVTEVNKQTSTEKKLLFLHDYMVSNYTYKNVDGNDSSSGYMLHKQTGVCSGYAYLYSYICNQVGILCYVTDSDDMNHCWNIVKLGSYYYHIDVTWDDPVPNTTGLVEHKYLLLSDSQISKTHKNWNLKNKVKCTKSLGSRYWRNIESPIILTKSYSYYVKNNNIVKRTLSSGKETVLVKGLGKWYKHGSSSSYWVGDFSGLFLDNNKLYFNTYNKIKKYDLKTKKTTTIKTVSQTNGRVYGIKQDGKNIKYHIKKTPTSTGSVYTLKNVVK